MRVLFLHDDTSPAPTLVRQVIGVDRFSDIVRRKRRLGDVIADVAQADGQVRFARAGRAEDLLAQIEAIEALASDDMVFRLPGALMPTNLERFAQTVRKLPFALDVAMFGERHEDDVPALLYRDDAVALLRLSDPRERRAFFSALAKRAVLVNDVCEFVDLRDISAFLGFMVGATEARHFNSTLAANGVLRKMSTAKDKMRAEYGFFHVAPEATKRFLLPTFDYVEDGERAGYAMEHMAVPDAALQMIHHSFDAKSFGRLLDSFFAFVGSRSHRADGVDRVRAIARADILGKMHARLDQMLATQAGARVDQAMRACGPMGGISAMRARADALIEAAIGRDRTATLAVGHGDPCLSNILYNREIGLFRLIDPRGAVTLDDAYMHPLYDVAKFSHSILGDYDFINNGLFECRLDERLELSLELDGNGVPNWARAAFRDRLKAHGFDYATVRAYELSLFLSMLPLHQDVPRKLPAFCLVAAKIINELERR